MLDQLAQPGPFATALLNGCQCQAVATVLTCLFPAVASCANLKGLLLGPLAVVPLLLLVCWVGAASPVQAQLSTYSPACC